MPEQPQLSWADRIAQSKKTTFKPLDFNTRYNFVVDSTTVKNSAKVGDFIAMKCKVLDGDRKNFTQTINVMPESENPWSFLQFFEAAGFSQDYLVQHNPSVDVIASNLSGRQFSVEVVQGRTTRDDGTYWPEFRNFAQVVANPSATPQGAPAQAPASNFGSAPQQSQAQPAQNFGNAPAPQQSNDDSSPWNAEPSQPENNGNSGGMVNPF